MSLSIILPVLDEGAIIADALERLHAQAPGAELLVVDGGSADATATLAEHHARVLHCEPGRARQLNLGAREAGGGWLLFLHADTCLPDGFEDAIAEAGRRSREAGVFSLRIVGSHPLLPLLSLGANLRTRLRRIFLGDQALFIRASLFRELGGFPDLPLLEDYAFSLLLKRKGVPIYLSPLKAHTSGRRWDAGGFFRTWLQFRRIFLRYHLHGGTAADSTEFRAVRRADQA